MSSLPDEPMWTWPFAPRRRMVTLRVQDQDVRFPPELKALPRETEADWMRLFWASVPDADAIAIAISALNELQAVWPFPLSVWDDPHASLLSVLTPLARVPASRIEVMRRTGQPDIARERHSPNACGLPSGCGKWTWVTSRWRAPTVCGT